MLSEPTVLTTDRLTIREFVEADWDGFLEMATDPDVAQVMHIDGPAESHAWFQAALAIQQNRFARNYNWGFRATRTTR